MICAFNVISLRISPICILDICATQRLRLCIPTRRAVARVYVHCKSRYCTSVRVYVSPKFIVCMRPTKAEEEQKKEVEDKKQILTLTECTLTVDFFPVYKNHNKLNCNTNCLFFYFLQFFFIETNKAIIIYAKINPKSFYFHGVIFIGILSTNQIFEFKFFSLIRSMAILNNSANDFFRASSSPARHVKISSTSDFMSATTLSFSIILPIVQNPIRAAIKKRRSDFSPVLCSFIPIRPLTVFSASPISLKPVPLGIMK